MNYDRLNQRAKTVSDLIAAGPDSKAKTAWGEYWKRCAQGDPDALAELAKLDEADSKELKQLILSAMVKETGGRFQPGGSDDKPS
jgi:hypothetical protein